MHYSYFEELSVCQRSKVCFNFMAPTQSTTSSIFNALYWNIMQLCWWIFRPTNFRAAWGLRIKRIPVSTRIRGWGVWAMTLRPFSIVRCLPGAQMQRQNAKTLSRQQRQKYYNSNWELLMSPATRLRTLALPDFSANWQLTTMCTKKN